MATISIAGRDELTEVEHFYRSVGEERSLASDEAVIIARHGEAIVGAVRLVVEQGVCQLRTMQVHPDFQRQGVGSALLDRFAGPALCGGSARGDHPAGDQERPDNANADESDRAVPAEKRNQGSGNQGTDCPSARAGDRIQR